MASTDGVKAGFWYFRESPQSFPPTDPPIPFTHLFCAFADISASTYQVTFPADCLDPFKNFAKASQVKSTLLSIGGVESYPSTVASMVSMPENRATFIQSSIQIARTNNFDGLDLFWPCWSYPPNTGPTPAHMDNLGLLLNEWQRAIQKDARDNNTIPLLLTATVFYTPKFINDPEPASYPAEAMSNNLNWINVRAYDLYDPHSSPATTEPPAALKNPTTNALFKNVDTGISNWMLAVPGKKLVLGLPYVGFEWSLKNPDDHGIFAPANEPGSGNNGSITYRKIMAKTGITHEFNPTFVTDYCYGGYNWIGYDGTESIKKKIQYAKEKTLGGYFAWHVCADDSHWPLSKTASEEWDK